jgi:hypothetical protein
LRANQMTTTAANGPTSAEEMTTAEPTHCAMRVVWFFQRGKYMHQVSYGVVSVLILNISCTALPSAHIHTGGAVGYQNELYAPEGGKLGQRGAGSSEGRDFCRHLEDRARTHAVDLLATGWITGIAAVLAVGAGTVLTASTPDNPTSNRNILNASLPVAGAALGYYSFGEFSREKDASDVAATAAAAINLKKDQDANAVCNEALGSWNTSRPNANKALVEALKGGSNGSTVTPPQPSSTTGESPPPAPPPTSSP